MAAERLGQLADVVALADGNTGWGLSQHLAGPLSCNWGAVRLYWPGFNHRVSKSSRAPRRLS